MICQDRLFVLVLLLLISACGKAKDGPTRWSSFPVAIYTDQNISSSPAAATDFNDAMAFWEGKAGRKLFDFKGTWDPSKAPYSGPDTSPTKIFGNVVFLQNPWDLGQTTAGETIVMSSSGEIDNSMVMINPNMQYCNGDCVGSGNTSQRKVFTHELGHFLGLNHVQDTANIMNPEVTPGGSLTDEQVDQATLRQLTF